MNRRSFIRARKGFTLVELLVVILILSILMTIALPLYVSTLSNASKRSCRANLHSIANAAQAWKVMYRYPDFSTLSSGLNELKADLGSMPICPDGGTYSKVPVGESTLDYDGTSVTVAAGEFGVKCSKTEHGGFVPGKMGN